MLNRTCLSYIDHVQADIIINPQLFQMTKNYTYLYKFSGNYPPFPVQTLLFLVKYKCQPNLVTLNFWHKDLAASLLFTNTIQDSLTE